MFRVECYCDDKRLGDVFRALAGLILKPPTAVPVVNAEVSNGEIVGIVAATDITDLLASHLKQRGTATIKSREIGAWLKGLGRSSNSATYTAKKAVEVGILAKTHRAGVYTVK